MARFLGKKYRLESSDNFDAYMKALGVGLLIRKLGARISSTVEVMESDGVYTLRLSSSFRSQVINFKLGEEFEENTPDGRKVKTTFTLEGNVLTQHQRGDKETTIIRTYDGDQLKVEMIIGDIKCTRIYKLVT